MGKVVHVGFEELRRVVFDFQCFAPVTAAQALGVSAQHRVHLLTNHSVIGAQKVCAKEI